MKDSLGQELKEGAIVVVKPTSRDSWMGMGFVTSTATSRATVVSFRRTTWYDEKKRIKAAFDDKSIYMVRSAHDMKTDHCFPDVFPEALKAEYTELFLERK